MGQEVDVVALGVVLAGVSTTALLARQRGDDGGLGAVEQVADLAGLQQVRVEHHALVGDRDLGVALAQLADLAERLVQHGLVAVDPDVVHHHVGQVLADLRGRLATGRRAQALDLGTHGLVGVAGDLRHADALDVDRHLPTGPPPEHEEIHEINLRNFYINRNFTNPTKAQGGAEEWTQSFILDAKSGFTQGTVGFGMDVLGLYSVKLDGGKGTGGTQLLPLDHDGRPADNFGRTGVAFKAKLSQTEMKVGEWMPVLPILRSDDGRSLPQTFRGGQITSKEIDGLTLYGGQFRANSPRDDSSMSDMSMTGKAAFTSDRFNFQGGEYAFNDKRTQIGLWNAELKDIYSQQYVNLIHSQPLGDWTLGANLGFFYGKDDGSARAGDLDNKTWSGMFSARYGGNTFYVGLQKLTGDSAWMRVNGTSGGTLANDSYNASYDNAAGALLASAP